MEGFEKFINGLTTRFTSVLNISFKPEDYIAIDLSQTNEELNKIDISSPHNFSEFINNYLKNTGKKVAFGGYSEVRKLYKRSKLFENLEDSRDVHLGMDFWASAYTGVLAVLDGKIHSFKDNMNFGDYGPTIILEHSIAGEKFYSLYGHLSRKSLENIEEGQEVKQGEKIAELGSAEENGNYAPHLHFQVIGHLHDKIGDFPGVASRRDLEFYLRNCPNPEFLLKINMNKR